MVIRKKPTQAVLANLYKVIRTIFEDEEFYYSKEQIEVLASGTVIERMSTRRASSYGFFTKERLAHRKEE